MSAVMVRGVGAVSPAGWGSGALFEALRCGGQIPLQELDRPGWTRPLRVRRVPSLTARPPCLAHPRLRRASAITQYAVAAAFEALGEDAALVAGQSWRLGVVACVMSGCVNYSRRFFDEALRDPATASPLVFPETVFNAPGSHLAAVLGTTAVNYTLVGDPATYLNGLALAAQWLEEGIVDGCLVVGAEELDWLTADAFRLFTRRMVASEGAGVLYLTRVPRAGGPVIELTQVTDLRLFWNGQQRSEAVRQVAADLAPEDRAGLLCDGVQGVVGLDAAEVQAWRRWKGRRVSVKAALGEGLMAAAAWQCVLAVETLRRGDCPKAWVSVTGCNAQAAGACFVGSAINPSGLCA